MTAYGWDGAVESLCYYFCGLLAGGDYCCAVRDLLQQCVDIGRCYYLQEGIGGVVFQPADLGCGVIKCQTILGAEVANIGLIETFFFDDAESVLIVEVYQAHDAPEVVDPVGVIKRHAPAVRLGRETAQEQDPCVLRQEGLKRVRLYHHPAKIQNVRDPKGTVLFGPKLKNGAKQNRPLWLLWLLSEKLLYLLELKLIVCKLP